MITEDYVSYEVARLLKEKGFDWMCNGYYNKDDEDSEPYFGDGEGADNWNNQPPSVKDLWCSAPTHQMAMKWLREIHNIFIVIEPHMYDYVNEKNSSYVTSLWQGDNYYENITSKDYPTFEEAVETTLKHCLTNLI